MARKTKILAPSIQRTLTTFGENIRLARLRREFSMETASQKGGYVTDYIGGH